MADLTKKQQKEFARTLYLKENLTQQEIAERVGCARQTLARWIKAEKWEAMKVGMTLGKEQQIANLYRQAEELNQKIMAREKGERHATTSEADIISKISSSIKKLETEAGIADLVSVGMRFIEWIRPVDLDKAKEVTKLWDKFIKDQL